VVSFIGGGNQSIQRKPLTVYRKSLTNIHSKYKTNSDKTVFPEKLNMEKIFEKRLKMLKQSKVNKSQHKGSFNWFCTKFVYIDWKFKKAAIAENNLF
jgi:hypothetical protein